MIYQLKNSPKPAPRPISKQRPEKQMLNKNPLHNKLYNNGPQLIAGWSRAVEELGKHVEAFQY